MSKPRTVIAARSIPPRPVARNLLPQVEGVRFVAGVTASPEAVTVATIEAEVDAAEAKAGAIKLADIVRIAGLVRDVSPDDAPSADQQLQRLVTAYKTANAVEAVAVFKGIPAGVALLKDDDVEVLIRKTALRFGIKEVVPCLLRIEAIAQDARQYWKKHESERKPHSQRAYGIASFAVAAIEQENGRHVPGDQPRDASPSFKDDLDSLKHQIEDAERQLAEAAQRSAQVRYGRGMLWGAGALVLVTAMLAAGFQHWGVKAAYGVAAPAGGLGAIVSVLQRMTTGRLSLDYRATAGMLTAFGAVRPLIGAIFGVAIMALIAGEVVSFLVVPDANELAFFAGLGFVAGFNERFAQDMLATVRPE